MNANELPSRVFMLGSKHSEGNFTPVVLKLDGDTFAIAVWTSEQSIKTWLHTLNRQSAYFDADIERMFLALTSNVKLRYLVVDPPENDDIYDIGSNFTRFNESNLIDLHSVPALWGVLARQMSDLLRSTIWQYALAHPELKPKEVMEQSAARTRSQLQSIEASGGTLAAQDTFDDAKEAARIGLLKAKMPPDTVKRVLDLWNLRPDLSLSETVSLLKDLSVLSLGNLRSSGNFETAWNFAKLELLGYSQTQLVNLRNVFESHDELTMAQAVAHIMQSRGKEISPSDVLPTYLSWLDQMTGAEFEGLVATLFKKLGFDIDATKASHDGGIDLVAHCHTPLFQGKSIIQCKRYSGSVGEPFVRDLYGVMISERANKGILVTNSIFTTNALAFAAGKPLELIDRAALIKLLIATHMVE